MARQMTPLLRPLRNGSGTIYVFPSAVEDIGLNLDSRSNRVSLSKYVILNLPDSDTDFDVDDLSLTTEETKKNYFNFTNIPGIANYLNNSSLNNNQKIASALQNYMMNMETTIVNQSDYDYSANATVSERVFWKFLKETGAIRWVRVDSSTLLNGGYVYKEEDDSSNGYQRVVQSIGNISAANSNSSDFGMYNETYVNIPSTYGGSEVFFKVVEDNNYRLGEVYTSDDRDYLSGRDSSSSSDTFTTNQPAYDSLSDSETYNQEYDVTSHVDSSTVPWYRYTDEGNEIEYSYYTEEEFDPDEDGADGINFKIVIEKDSSVLRSFYRSRLDGVEVVTDIDEIDAIYDQLYEEHSYITYDSINIDDSLIHTSEYNFNAILLYYTIYDKDNNNELATNLFGIVFLNSPEVDTMKSTLNSGDSLNFSFPVFTKKKSGGAGSNTYFGTGYSFKINIRSLSIYDNTDAFINDETTTSSLYTEDFNEVLYNLNRSTDLIQKNSQILNSVFDDYKTISAEVDDLNYSVQNLVQKFNQMNQKKFTDIDSSNINTYDLTAYHSTEISGYLHIDSDTDLNIPIFDVSTLNAIGVASDYIDTTILNADEIEIGTVVSDEIDSSLIEISQGGLYLENCGEYLSFDSGIFKEIISLPVSSTSETESYNDKIKQIIESTSVNYHEDSETFEIEPNSFSGNDFGTEFSLYHVDGTRGFVNYLAYIPILVQQVKNLDSSVKELYNKQK